MPLVFENVANAHEVVQTDRALVQLSFKDHVEVVLGKSVPSKHDLRRELQLVPIHRVRSTREGAEHGPHLVAQAGDAADALENDLRVLGDLLPQVLRAERLLLEVALDGGPDAHGVEEERVVAEVGVELVVGHALVAHGTQGVGNLLLLPDGEEHVVLHADDEGGLHGGLEPRLEARPAVGVRSLHGEPVHGLGDPEQRVRVVVVHPLPALVRQIPLDLELQRQARGAVLLRALEATLAEALLPLLAGAVGDGADLPGKTQAALRQLAVVVVAVLPVGVVHDRRPLRVSEGDAPGEALGARGDGDELRHALRVRRRRANALHAAQGGADARVQPLDAEVIQQQELRGDLVSHLEARERAAVPLPRPRVHCGWPRAAIATSQVVGANDEEEVRVERLPRADVVLPPTFSGIPGMRAGVGRRRHAALEQDRVVLVPIQVPPCLVRDPELGQLAAWRQLEGLRVVVDLVADEVARGVRRLLVFHRREGTAPRHGPVWQRREHLHASRRSVPEPGRAHGEAAAGETGGPAHGLHAESWRL
mmetsp:Transcript_117383/g.328581  ORF Transcript_117383/g.328581 Transcript_117383/m.328581 type:complete len:536 (-) Transcript_117383:25-1632(-)